MRSIDPWTHAVRWPISGTAMSSVSYPGKREEGKRFWILDIPPLFVQRDTVYREVNKFYLFIVSFIIFIRGDLFWDSISWRLINLFCSVIWLEKLEGVGRTWKASIEQNQSQEARCQPNVMKTYPPGLGRLLPSRDERWPRKRKSEVKRNVWWPPNIDAIFLILFLRSSPSPMENLLSRSIDLNKK